MCSLSAPFFNCIVFSRGEVLRTGRTRSWPGRPASLSASWCVAQVCPDEKLLGKEGGGGECLGGVRHVGYGAVAGGDSQCEGGREQIIRWSDETH